MVAYVVSFMYELRVFELEIRELVTETAHVFDSSGELILTKTGDINSVAFTSEELRMIEGNILTHNHPSGSSFSEADIKFLLANLPIELRVVTIEYRHSILLPSDPSAVFFRLNSTVDRIYEQVQVSLMNAIRRGTITRIDANQQFWHEVWVRVSEELGLQYQREEWGDE